MDIAIKSLVFTYYNKAKGAGKRGQLEEKRVNRALRLIQEGKLDEKCKQYGTTVNSCNCPDSVHRGEICYHRIAAMIMQRVYEDVQRIWLDEFDFKLW